MPPPPSHLPHNVQLTEGLTVTTIIRKAKTLIKSLFGRDLYRRIDCRCRKERFGSEYGGWDVAVKKMNKDSIVYSFGVGEDVSFDLALLGRFGLTVHAFDPTPKSITWVKRQEFPKNFIFHEYGIADFDGNASFNPPVNPEHVSHTLLDRPETKDRAIAVPVKRLSTIMKELGHSRIDLLKMDVEGAEYGVIIDAVQSAIRPEQLLVEFHHKFPNVGIAKTEEAVSELRKMGYKLFSVSRTGDEFCFCHESR